MFLRRQNQRSCTPADRKRFVVDQQLHQSGARAGPSSARRCPRRRSWAVPEGPLTLKTNISRRKNATVLKLPSQMFGLPFPGSAGRSVGGRGGREWRSCLRSEVDCVRRAGRVGNGLVGSIMAVGIPEDRQNFQEEVPREPQGAEPWSGLRWS